MSIFTFYLWKWILINVSKLVSDRKKTFQKCYNLKIFSLVFEFCGFVLNSVCQLKLCICLHNTSVFLVVSFVTGVVETDRFVSGVALLRNSESLSAVTARCPSFLLQDSIPWGREANLLSSCVCRRDVDLLPVSATTWVAMLSGVVECSLSGCDSAAASCT